ncbi:G-protein coupled receptor, partial [Dermatophagoides farinae]
FAYRICDNNGTWINNWTNYTECLLLIANNESDTDASKYQFIRQLVIFIMFSCSMLSLILLSITFFIFTYFRSLTSCRLRVHRNLVLALILHSLCLLLIASPHLFNPDESLSSYWEIEWLCKSILTLKLYSTLASINWMFIEGFQLHSRVTVSILRKDAPFKLYHFLGWGIPLVLVTAWALQMSLTMDTLCWNGYAHSLYIWIIVGPMILALSVNCIFLVNIIRVLLTKLRLTVTIEIKQIRKAIKATALLFPLLGISHLLFCINPDDNGRLEDAYLIFNAFLQSSQGIFVSILYCFMDTDVQQALKLTYQRTVFKNRSFPTRWSRQTATTTAAKTPTIRDRNLGSFKFVRQPMINNIVRTNSLNEINIGMEIANHANRSLNDKTHDKDETNKHLARQNNGFALNTTKMVINSTAYGHQMDVREILSQQSQSQRSAGKTISPSTTRESQTLCIMYNSNGEMVRFKPKIQYSNPKPYSMPDTGIIAIEIDPKTKKR